MHVQGINSLLFFQDNSDGMVLLNKYKIGMILDAC